MAKNNNPSTISPTGIAQEMPVKITEPDMDVLEWEKKHIEIPEQKARMAGLPIQGIDPKETGEPVVPKIKRVAHLFTSLERVLEPGRKRKSRAKANGIKKNAMPIDQNTELRCTASHREKAREMLEDPARSFAFAYLDGEISRLRFVIDDHRYRLEDIEAGKRCR